MWLEVSIYLFSPYFLVSIEFFLLLSRVSCKILIPIYSYHYLSLFKNKCHGRRLQQTFPNNCLDCEQSPSTFCAKIYGPSRLIVKTPSWIVWWETGQNKLLSVRGWGVLYPDGSIIEHGSPKILAHKGHSNIRQFLKFLDIFGSKKIFRNIGINFVLVG